MKEVVTFEPPKTLHINFWGKLSPEHADELFDKWATFVDPKDKVDILLDASELEDIPPKTREILRKRGSEFHMSCLSIFGASAKIRILGGLIIKMLPNVDRSKFVETKEEAIAWMKQ